MFKSSAGKLFFFFLAVLAASCNVWQDGNTSTPSLTPFVAAELKSEIPFSTKEPEIYQLEIISQTYAGGDKSERKTLSARRGASRVTGFNAGEKNEIHLLELDNNQVFSIHHGRKVFAENLASSLLTSRVESDFLTTEWLNRKTPAVFENLEAENNLSKFRVRLGDNENSNSEILIYVDENLDFPVKQEFYSINGDQRTLASSVEMKNFKSDPDKKLFELPKDYRKISPKEFLEIVWLERSKDE